MGVLLLGSCLSPEETGNAARKVPLAKATFLLWLAREMWLQFEYLPLGGGQRLKPESLQTKLISTEESC